MKGWIRWNLLGVFLILAHDIPASTMEQQRTNFILAEKLLEQTDEGLFLNLSEGLADYPLYPLLQYQWLKKNLPQTDKVLTFLAAYKDTRQANLLKSLWLEYLAKQERWPEFIQHYEANDNISLACQFQWANYKMGRQQQALEAAKKIWSSSDSLPNECDALLVTLTLSPAFTSDLLWQRFELALSKDNLNLAKYLTGLMSKHDQSIANVWLQVQSNPQLIQRSDVLSTAQQQQGLVFAHGVMKLAKSDLSLAINLWDLNKQQFKLDHAKVQQIERKLAIALALKRDDRAYDRIQHLGGIDPEIREWRVRAALLDQNWIKINEALSGLTPEEQQDPKWQYWQARTRAAMGDPLQAKAIYSRVANDRSFYGFLASESLNQPYQLSIKPLLLVDDEISSLIHLPDFKVIQELRYLNRELEAQREWWFAIKKLNQSQLRVAAKLAQQWRWDQIAITTLVKADYWDDIELRFPVDYLPQIQGNSEQQQLQPAVILGLIRQESMLDKNAQSSVGARGLMQIMPKTGQQIAHELNEKWLSDADLFSVDTNIKYGTYYFKKLLNRFNGHLPLAIAAYNAGPSNVTKWLPIDKSVPADIWMETIPFKETRKYVASVLSYTMIYQQRIQSGALKIKELLWDVTPAKN